MKTFHFPQDEEGDAVGEWHESSGDAPPLTTHWDTFHSESKLPSSDAPALSEVAASTGLVSALVLVADAEIGR